jgi:hypothetical protein
VLFIHLFYGTNPLGKSQRVGFLLGCRFASAAEPRLQQVIFLKGGSLLSAPTMYLSEFVYRGSVEC